MLNADCVIIDCLHSALYLESKQSRPVSGVCSTSGEIWDVTVNSPVYLSDSLYLSLAVKYQQTRREMASWTGWLIVLYQARLLQAELAGPVGDSLDRLVLADLEFWAGREVADISQPGTVTHQSVNWIAGNNNNCLKLRVSSLNLVVRISPLCFQQNKHF